jgi:hypothetical protein
MSLRGEKRTEFRRASGTRLSRGAAKNAALIESTTFPASHSARAAAFRSVRGPASFTNTTRPTAWAENRLWRIGPLPELRRRQDAHRRQSAHAESRSCVEKTYGLQPTKRRQIVGRGFAKAEGQRPASSPVKRSTDHRTALLRGLHLLQHQTRLFRRRSEPLRLRPTRFSE